MKRFNVIIICTALLFAGAISGCQRPSPTPKKAALIPGNTERIKVKGANLSLKDFKGNVRWDLNVEDIQENVDGMKLNRVTGLYYPPEGGPRLNIWAAEGWINPEYNRLELRYGVEMKRQRFSLRGEVLAWDSLSGVIKLKSNVLVQSENMEGRGEVMTTDANFDNVRFEGGSTWSVLQSRVRPQRRKP